MAQSKTISGVSEYVRSKREGIVIGLADPRGTKMYRWFKDGKLESTEGDSTTEGIGQGRITENLVDTRVDQPFLITDDEALPVLFDVLRYEGLCLGCSSAINLAGAVRLAGKLAPGETIVTILCDSETRYASKLWHPAFLRDKQLPVPTWLETENTRDLAGLMVPT